MAEQVLPVKAEGNLHRRLSAWIYLVLGILYTIDFGILIMSNVTGIIVIDSLGLDLTFVIWYLLFGIDLALVAKFFIVPAKGVRENKLGILFRKQFPEVPQRDVHFWSIAWSRLGAGLLLVGIGVANILIMGLNIGEENEYGIIFFLGGPSPAYLTGFYPGVFGLLLVGYFFVSITRIHVYESEHTWFFIEGRPTLPHLTEIPKGEVEGLQIRNTKFGGKFAWVLILLPFIVLNFGFGIIFLFGPLPSTQSVELGWILVGNGILTIPALVLLMTWRQHFLEIVTGTKRYEKYFFVPLIRKTALPQMRAIFGVEFNSKKNQGDSAAPETGAFMENRGSSIIPAHDRFRLLMGTAFVGLAALARAFYVGLGMLTAWGLLLYGAVLIINALARDRSKGVTISYNDRPQNGQFRYTWHRGHRYEDVLMYQVQKIDGTTAARSLDAFDFFGTIFLACILGTQVGQTLVFPATESAAWEEIFSWILSAGILLLLTFYHSAPRPVVKITSPSLKYALPITHNPPSVDPQGASRGSGGPREYLSYLRSSQGRVARRRVILIISIFCLSAGASATYWFTI